MNFWPEKSFTIATQLSPEEVKKILAANTEEREINRIPAFNIPKYKPKKYIGIINNTNFTLYNNTSLYSQISAKRGYYVAISGNIEAGQEGSIISFKVQYDKGHKETTHILSVVALLIIVVAAVYYYTLAIIIFAVILPVVVHFWFKHTINFYAKKNIEILSSLLQ